VQSKNSLPALNAQPKPVSAEESRLSHLIAQASSSPRAPALRSIAAFISEAHPNLSEGTVSEFVQLLTSVLSSPLPFSAVKRGYRQIFFVPCDLPDDVATAYDLFRLFNGVLPDCTSQFLRCLVRRLGSASLADRTGAKGCLMTLDGRFCDRLLRMATVCLSSAPPHGVDVVLDCIAYWLAAGGGDSALLRSLEGTLHILHFAPHYQTYHASLVNALRALHERDDEAAHRSRRFILANWPRLDPQRAVLFMQEATAICTNGPPVDPFVWQRLSWRACSIQWQLASEGLAFIQKTIGGVGGADHAVLRFLLEDEVRTHWSAPVKDEAREVLASIPAVPPERPKTLALDKWNLVSETAKANYPSENFARRQRSRK
jgi:hypothetical protein